MTLLKGNQGNLMGGVVVVVGNGGQSELPLCVRATLRFLPSPSQPLLSGDCQ